MGILSGKIVLLTGATNGIGLEASVTLAKEGATLVIVGRDPLKIAKSLAEIRQRSGSNDVSALQCDFSSQTQIRSLAEAFRKKYERLDILVNNAGAVYPKRVITEDGIETTFAVNHLGYFLLTHLLLDLILKATPGARIVNVASRAHYRAMIDFENLNFENGGFSTIKAYSQSKLGNVIFTRTLAKHLEGKGVTVNCLHPGVVATGIWANSPWYVRPLIQSIAKLFFISAKEGGKTISQLVLDKEVERINGEYFSDHAPQKVSRLARDEAIATRLWQESIRLVGIHQRF